MNQRIEILTKDLETSMIVQTKETEIKNIMTEKYTKLLRLLPRSEEYVDNIELLPMIRDMSRLQTLTKTLNRSMPDPKELPLVLDIDNILDSIRAVPTSLLQTKHEYQLLKEELYLYQKEAQGQIQNLQSQCIEFMTLFRRIELGRQNMCDVVTQTQVTGPVIASSNYDGIMTAFALLPKEVTQGMHVPDAYKGRFRRKA